MATLYLLFQVFLILVTAAADRQVVRTHGVAAISKHDFPTGFVFGAASSAYQVEGAAAEDGRKPSIWDTYTHAGKIIDKSTGDIAADQYHKYKEDVGLMKDMGLDAYRFSISWSRLIPDGRGAVNPKGLQYYNNLINELINNGIQPHVTLYHFDLPQALEDEYEGLLSPKIIKDFTAYAEVCFKEFGDRVKFWSTFNEPNILTILGYDIGNFPPGRCSYPSRFNCSKGNSTTEAYIVAHNILLSHAAAADVYKEKYQEEQRGNIGMTLLACWVEPLTNSLKDATAAQRVLDFHIGWFLDPLANGNYPAVMRKIIGSNLPSFTADESRGLKGSFDFIGLNHYAVLYVQDFPSGFDNGERDYLRDMSAKISYPASLPGKYSIRLKAPLTPTAPWGLQRLLEYIKLYYKNPAVMIHENGLGIINDNSSIPKDDDAAGADYLQGYIESLLQSVRNGSNTRGYFVWSFVDCFENTYGYTAHYGLYRVNFGNNDRKRSPRLTAQWYSSFLKNRGRKGETSEYLYTE